MPIKRSEVTIGPAPSNGDIFDALLTRREEQDRKWGGPDHDDRHSEIDWMQLIEIYSQGGDEGPIFEDRMLDVAALAFAAIQSSARKISKYASDGNGPD